MQPQKEKNSVGQTTDAPVREVLETMVFDLCGITHALGQAHSGCVGCGECLRLNTYGLAPGGWQ